MTHKNAWGVPERKRIITSYSEKRTAFISTLKKDTLGFSETLKNCLRTIWCPFSAEVRMSGPTPLLPLYAYVACTGRNLSFFIRFHITDGHTPIFIVGQKPHVSFIAGLVIFTNKEFKLIKPFKWNGRKVWQEMLAGFSGVATEKSGAQNRTVWKQTLWQAWLRPRAAAP